MTVFALPAAVLDAVFASEAAPELEHQAVEVDDAELLARFARHQRACNHKPTTLAGYRETVRPFGFWLADHGSSFLTATGEDVESWLEEHEIQASTKARYISRIASFYAWLIREGHTDRDPTRRVDRPRLGRYLPRPAPTDRIRAVLAACDDRVAAMIACGAFTGMRRFEIAKLRGEDLEFDGSTPMVRIRGKGDVDRRVPLNPAVVAALVRHGLPAAGWVFPSPRGTGPLSAQRTGRLIADALSTAGGRVTAHQLRHAFGTRLYETSGADLLIVQRMMGDRSRRPRSTRSGRRARPRTRSPCSNGHRSPGLR
jgi:integrase/recombinase XerD